MGKTPEAWNRAFPSGPLKPVSLDYSSIDKHLLPYAGFAAVGLYMLQGESSTLTGGLWKGVFRIAEQQYEELRLGDRRAPKGFAFNERKEQPVFLGNARIEPFFPSTEVADVIYNSTKQFSINAAVRGNRSGFLQRRTP